MNTKMTTIKKCNNSIYWLTKLKKQKYWKINTRWRNKNKEIYFKSKKKKPLKTESKLSVNLSKEGHFKFLNLELLAKAYSKTKSLKKIKSKAKKSVTSTRIWDLRSSATSTKNYISITEIHQNRIRRQLTSNALVVKAVKVKYRCPKRKNKKSRSSMSSLTSELK